MLHGGWLAAALPARRRRWNPSHACGPGRELGNVRVGGEAGTERPPSLVADRWAPVSPRRAALGPAAAKHGAPSPAPVAPAMRVRLSRGRPGDRPSPDRKGRPTRPVPRQYRGERRGRRARRCGLTDGWPLPSLCAIENTILAMHVGPQGSWVPSETVGRQVESSPTFGGGPLAPSRATEGSARPGSSIA